MEIERSCLDCWWASGDKCEWSLDSTKTPQWVVSNISSYRYAGGNRIPPGQPYINCPAWEKEEEENAD